MEARKAIQKIYDGLKESESKVDDFWEMAHFANIILTQYLLGISKAKKEDITVEYLKLWNLAGNKGQKIGELEHFEIICTALTKAKNQEKLIEDLKEIIKELEEAF